MTSEKDAQSLVPDPLFNSQIFIPSQSNIGFSFLFMIDRFMEAKYSLFYDILSHDTGSDPSPNSIYDRVLLLNYTLSQAIDELKLLLQAKEDAKNNVQNLVSTIAVLKLECTSSSIQNRHLRNCLERKSSYLDSIGEYVNNAILSKFTFGSIDSNNSENSLSKLEEFGHEALSLFEAKHRHFIEKYQLFYGQLVAFPHTLSLFNGYVESGIETVKSFEKILSDLELKNVYSLKQFNQFPDLMCRFEENITENSSESKLYLEQVRLMREGVAELKKNIGELKRQKSYLQKGVKEIKEGLSLLNRHLGGISEFNENTSALKAKDTKLIEAVLSKSATLEKLFVQLHSQRKEALSIIEKYRAHISETDLEAFLDADAHIAHTFSVSEVLDEMTLDDS